MSAAATSSIAITSEHILSLKQFINQLTIQHKCSSLVIISHEKETHSQSPAYIVMLSPSNIALTHTQGTHKHRLTFDIDHNLFIENGESQSQRTLNKLISKVRLAINELSTNRAFLMGKTIDGYQTISTKGHTT